MAEPIKMEELLARLTDDSGSDILICNAGMMRGIERNLINQCCKRRKRKSVLLILVTSGGDADVAFRISRYLQQSYEKFTCIVSGWCKSAGTLIALGAQEIVFGVHGELGPLDVQMAKKDELMDSESGLTVMAALTAIHEKTLLAFDHFFLETTIKAGGRLSVQTASEIAVGLATGLFSPISSQIDPIHIGEAWRSMAVAKEYGQRLIAKSHNADSDGLDKIITEYPSHGFVIDRAEAETIFENVRPCTGDEQDLINHLANLALLPTPKPFIKFLNKELPETKDADTDTSKEEPNANTPAQAGGNAAQEESAAAGENTQQGDGI